MIRQKIRRKQSRKPGDRAHRRKSQKGHLLLHWKLATLFTIFGLGIGTFMIVLGFHVQRNIVVERIQIMSRNMREDFILDATGDEETRFSFAKQTEALGMLSSLLKFVFPQMEEDQTVGYNFYLKPTENGLWSIGSSLNGKRSTVSPELIKIFEKTKKHGVYLPLFGEHQQSLFLDISTNLNDNAENKKDLNSSGYILEFFADMFSFQAWSKQNIPTYIGMFLIILGISFFSGFIFAGRITHSISDLTEGAEALAAGNLDIDFNNKRKDDIGKLATALNTMSINIAHKINSMQTMNKIDRAVLSPLSEDELIQRVTGFIGVQFPDSKILVGIFPENKESIQVVATFPKGKLKTGARISSNLVPGEYLDNLDRPFDFIYKEEKDLPYSPKNGIPAFSVPLFQSENLIGIVIILKPDFSEQDKESLIMLGDQIGVALKSFNDNKERLDLHQALLLSLTRTIDAKSKWTAGHSERVSSFAVKIAKELSLCDKDIETIKIGALLHDIGKLSIPEAILDKPTQLTPAEFDIIKIHPVSGEEILGDIPNFLETCNMVRHHHERWDGSGYPDGLKKEEIPLFARIITVADVYDAISEDRPYRKGFTEKETIDFISDQREKILDPLLADICLAILRKEQGDHSSSA